MKVEQCITDEIPIEIIWLCIIFTALTLAFVIYVLISVFAEHITKFHNNYEEFKKWKELNKTKNEEEK
jgi:hypothetical protein